MTRLLDLTQARPLLSAAIAGGVLGLAIGAWGTVEIEDSAPTSAPAWRLPGPGALLRSDESRFAAVRGADVWGAAPAARGRGRAGSVAGEAVTGAWRLLGVVSEPDQLALIVTEASGELARVATGEALPDGARLLEIGDTLIRFEREGCRFERRLYAPGAESETGGCPASETMPEAKPSLAERE